MRGGRDEASVRATTRARERRRSVRAARDDASVRATRDDASIRALLAATRRVAVVGASPRPERPSHAVMLFLRDRGLDVVAVNPGRAGGEIGGVPVVADLDAAMRHFAPDGLDLVDVFRAPAEAGATVDAAIRVGARAVWLQLGVIDHAAVARAGAAGLIAVMDRCPAIEWPRLGLDMAPRAVA